jgi:hypothetical protein
VETFAENGQRKEKTGTPAFEPHPMCRSLQYFCATPSFLLSIHSTLTIHILIMIVPVSTSMSATMAVEKQSVLRLAEDESVALLKHIFDGSLALFLGLSITIRLNL